jgi:hypothetical protein
MSLRSSGLHVIGKPRLKRIGRRDAAARAPGFGTIRIFGTIQIFGGRQQAGKPIGLFDSTVQGEIFADKAAKQFRPAARFAYMPAGGS